MLLFYKPLVPTKIEYPADHKRARPIIVHVEAGLRSFDRDMPEEVNQILTDAISDLLFTTEDLCLSNLQQEGIAAEKVHFVGPMSLDVADIDEDGDIEVVVGEHNLKQPEKARLYIYENSGHSLKWNKHLVYTGDEHHDGAEIVDIDNDGDKDIISIGWGHSQVIVYENRNGLCPQRDKFLGR